MRVPALEVEHAYRECEQITRHEVHNHLVGAGVAARATA